MLGYEQHVGSAALMDSWLVDVGGLNDLLILVRSWDMNSTLDGKVTRLGWPRCTCMLNIGTGCYSLVGISLTCGVVDMGSEDRNGFRTGTSAGLATWENSLKQSHREQSGVVNAAGQEPWQHGRAGTWTATGTSMLYFWTLICGTMWVT